MPGSSEHVKVLVVHGLGMDMRGVTEIEVFGPMTLAEYDDAILGYAAELGVDVEIFHSNIEAETIAKLAEASRAGVDAAIMNPSGYMVGHPAVTKAIRDAPFPTYELHMSNPAARGRDSETAAACKGVIAGFGIEGYRMALAAITAQDQP